MATASAADDNMIPGQTYTFEFSLDNLITRPATSKIQSDLQSNAPDFVNTNLVVTTPQTVNPFSNVYDVQFTYTGDGSDVVSDVAAAIIEAIKSGSNDDLTFNNAYADVAGNVSSTGIGGAVKQTLDQSMSGLASVVNQATQQAAKSTQQILTPVEVAVAIVIGLVVLLIFTSGKAGGLAAGPEGVNIGGSK